MTILLVDGTNQSVITDLDTVELRCGSGIRRWVKMQYSPKSNVIVSVIALHEHDGHGV